MSDNRRSIALWTLTVLGLACIALAYVIETERDQPTPTPEAAVELSEAAPAPSKVEPLPPLLELTPIPEITYSLPADVAVSVWLTCSEFEVLPTSGRNVFLSDVLDSKGVDILNPCVRDHTREASDFVVTQCREGDSIAVAFARAVDRVKVECDPRVPQWDLEPATSHREFLGEIF